MGLRERLRQDYQTQEAKLAAERSREEAAMRERKARDASEREKQRQVEEQLWGQARATLNRSHFPEIISSLQEDQHFKYDVEFREWGKKDQSLADKWKRKKYPEDDIANRVKSFSVGYIFTYYIQHGREYFAIEARADGGLVVHSKRTKALRSDSSVDEQDNALEKAYFNPLVFKYKANGDSGGRGEPQDISW